MAQSLCYEIEYDWGSLNGYKGKYQPSTNKKQSVCDGYANEVCKQFLNFDFVSSVEKWSGANHAWNVVNLIDGRKLYVDLCWFDGEVLDQETGLIQETDNYRWLNITYDKTEFTYSGVGYGSTKFCHAYGKLKQIFKDEEI